MNFINILLILKIILSSNNNCDPKFIFSTLKNYSKEIHNVQTKDNFELMVFRIQSKNNISNNKEPILLVHGIVDSSDNFLVNQENSIAIFLIEKGYDVWLINTRGNKYSRNNKIYNINSFEFWDHSFEEMGRFDIPDTVNYILKINNNNKITILGHSQGTTAIFAALSENSKLNNKIKKFIAVAPIVYMYNLHKSFKESNSFKILIDFLQNINFKEFLPSDCVKSFNPMWIIRSICEYLSIICNISLSEIDSNSENYIRIDKLKEYFKFYPGGSSTKSFSHFFQISKIKFEDRSLRKYDYGEKMNLIYYGNKIPTKYNFKNIKVPIVLINGLNDNLSESSSVEQFYQDFNKILKIKKYTYSNFGHSSIFWAKDNSLLKKDIYNEINN